MKAYVITTGITFALLTLIHVGRIVWENTRLAVDPPFVMTTLACAGLAVWAAVVLAKLPRQRARPSDTA